MRRTAFVVTVAGLVLAGCTGAGSDGRSASTERRSASTTTTEATDLTWSATASGEQDVDGNYRQGLARSGDGWIFVTNDAIYRTDSAFARTDELTGAIPAGLSSQGYDHLGDPDVAEGMIWVPVERDDKSKAEQVTARYDEDTLAYVDSVVVPQHHNSFVAVDDGIVYSTDEFSDDAIVRYRIADGKAVALAPLRLSQTVDRIQGGDVADGALWLSTDDDHNGVYRVDLETGEVTDLGPSGHVDGEGEGIDATDLPGGLLHVLVADEAIAPMWVIDMAVSSKPTS